MARGFAEERTTTSDYGIYPSLFSALATIESVKAGIVNTAVKEQGSTTRTALKGLVDFDRAINSGMGAQWMRSLVDLTTAPLEREPADPQLMVRVGQVREAHPGQTDAALAPLIWENAGLIFSPAGQQAYGNVQQLKQITGMYDDDKIKQLLLASNLNANAVRGAIAMLDQAKLQEQTVDIQRSAQAELLPDMQVFLRQHPNLDAPEAQAAAEEWKKAHTSQLAALKSRLSPAVLQSAVSQLNKPIELTGASKAAYDQLERDRLAMLAKTTAASERDKAAHLIASPMFQEWAKSNGLSVGHIEQPDPKATYEPGQVTPGVGIYVPGPDDVQAVELAKRQSVMSPDKAHPFMRKGPAQWGSINVATGEPTAPAAPTKPDSEDFTGEGGYLYRRVNDKIMLIGGPGSKATSANPIELPLDAQKQAMAENIANRLRSNPAFKDAPAADIMEAAKESVDDELKAHAAPAAPPTEAGKPATTKVYGKLDPMWAGDPIGSRRVNGQLYLYDKASDSYRRAPEQEGLAAPADVTRERVRPFAQAIQEYKDRRATNIARRAEDLEPQQKYPFRTAGLNIAQTLTPTKQTAAEKARAEEYAYQMEQARRQQETKVDEALPQQDVPSVTPAGVGMQSVAPPLQAKGPSTSKNAAAQAEPPRAVAAPPPPLDQRTLLQRQMFQDKEGNAQLAGEEQKFSAAAQKLEPTPADVALRKELEKPDVADAALAKQRAAAIKGSSAKMDTTTVPTASSTSVR